jgi:GNAT superfamily N-acetyltransferase
VEKRELFRIRPGLTSDEPYIFTTWLKSLRYTNSWFKLIDQQSYFKTYHQVIERILERPTITVNVACLADDDDVILGYSVLEPQILHWVFVKEPWRRIGIASDLIPKDIHTVTHLTKMGIQLKPDNVIFNPFL